MKGLHFAIPETDLSAAAHRLEQAYVVGLDRMPWPSQIEWVDGHAVVRRAVSESGCVHVPWPVRDFGEVFLQTSCLMERERPYHLGVELARGQLNKLRNQIADWEMFGMPIPDVIHSSVVEASRIFARATRVVDLREADQLAHEILRNTLWTAEGLTESYSKIAIANRLRSPHGNMPRLGCQYDETLGNLPNGTEQYKQLFQHITLPVRWSELEPEPGKFDWKRLDRAVEWCTRSGLAVTFGPILDFRADRLPPWLSRWQNDVDTLAQILVEMVQRCVERYQAVVRSWETTARTNSTNILSLTEEQTLWITAKMIDVVRQADPQAEVVFTVDQPWGDYLAKDDRGYSPFTYVDRLLRTGSKISAINLELAMTYVPGGSFSRGLLDISRLLDQFRELGRPLRVRLFFPAGSEKTNGAVKQAPLSAPGGQWRAPLGAQIQGEWAERALQLALAKFDVDQVTWGQYFDRSDNDWPHSGLFDEQQRPRPIAARIQHLREVYFTR